MFKNIKNYILNRYMNHDEAIIISCYFNPQKSKYRKFAFDYFYKSIKHLNHLIIECVIGDTEPELPENEFIKRIHTKNLLWHKEALLNMLISSLPPKYKYVFWVDADIIFTNKNWVLDGVKELSEHGNKIVQLFDMCVHLEKDELEPSFDVNELTQLATPNDVNKMVWRSFGYNYVMSNLFNDTNYNNHGHVGFAWGARVDLLKKIKLYDKALIGGADHIIAHAAAGQLNHSCIKKAFSNTISEINEWSRKFSNLVGGNFGYVSGTIYHIWHGNIEKRDYLNRIKEFDKNYKKIKDKDENGLYEVDDDTYMKNYFKKREADPENDSFLKSVALGYATNDGLTGGLVGGNLMGGMIGDMLNTSEDKPNETEFGGGNFGGAGAEGSWSENFS